MSPLVVPFRNLHQMRDVYAVSPGGDAAPLEVHIATRSDGLPGTGTLLDPYNGTLDFDKCVRRLTVAPYLDELGYPKKMVMYVHQGDYEGDGFYWYWLDADPAWTGVPFYPSIENSKGFWILPGMTVIGVGRVTYKLRAWPVFTNGVPWPYEHVLFGTCTGVWSLGGAGAQIHGIHFNCNASNLDIKPAFAKVGAVRLNGDDVIIQNCSYEDAAGYNFGDKPIVSITVAAQTVIEVTAHGFKHPDLITLVGNKMAGGGAGTGDDPDHSEVNGLFFAVPIDADHFYISTNPFIAGDNRKAVTIPVSVPGTATYGGTETFVFVIGTLTVPPPNFTGFPDISGDVNRGKILDCKAGSFIGGYGVCFAVFAGDTGYGGTISRCEATDHIGTCVMQVIGKGHEMTFNKTTGSACLTHLDTGNIEELLIGYNTVLDSPATPIRLHAAFLGARLNGTRIIGNYLENSYDGPEVVAMVLLYTSGDGEEISDTTVDGNTMRFIGSSPNVKHNIYALVGDGINIKNNIVTSDTSCSIADTCTGVTLKNNKTVEGGIPYDMEDTMLSASMHLSANQITGLANVLVKVLFNVIAYDYSRRAGFANIVLSKFEIPEAGFYKVGVNVLTSEVLWTWVVYVNEVLSISLCRDKAMGGTLGFGSASSDIMYFNSGDDLEFYASASAGSQVIAGHAFALPTSSCWIEAVNR